MLDFPKDATAPLETDANVDTSRRRTKSRESRVESRESSVERQPPSASLLLANGTIMATKSKQATEDVKSARMESSRRISRVSH